MIALYLFPLSVTIITPLCCFVPYLLAIYYGHVNPVLPCISDTGGILPESSLFSQLMDINAIMISFTAFIRYKQIKIDLQNPNLKSKQLELLNRICLYLMYLASFGGFIMGNYRITELLLGHVIGVALAFGSTIIYFVLMGFLSLKISTNKLNKHLAKCRLLIALFAIIFSGFMILFGSLSIFSITIPRFLENDFRLNWTSSDPGFVWHCLSTLFEWLTVLTVSPYFMTFIPEMNKISWKYLRQTNDKLMDGLNTDTNANQVV